MFKPGQSGNPAGKPKGAQDKVTKRVKEAFENLLNGQLESIEKDLKAIENPKEKLDIILKLSEYVLPKLARQEIQVDTPKKEKSELLKAFEKYNNSK